MPYWRGSRSSNYPFDRSSRSAYESPKSLLGSSFYIARSPPEISPSPTHDIRSIIKQLEESEAWFKLSVMDFLVVSSYNSVYFDEFTRAIVQAGMVGKKGEVMISWWQHSEASMAQDLLNLQQLAGPNLEVRVALMPGWNMTEDTTNANAVVYPKYSRVAHGKYVLTDQSVNIGTSNHAWAYFYETAGASYVTDDEVIRGRVGQVFERDWGGAIGLDQFMQEVLGGEVVVEAQQSEHMNKVW